MLPRLVGRSARLSLSSHARGLTATAPAAPRRRVGIIGYGAVGQYVASKIMNDPNFNER
jgi:phosphoglycerate dehydrogenase-like enzyme